MVFGDVPYRRASAFTATPSRYAWTTSAAWSSSIADGHPSTLPEAPAAATPSLVFSEIMSRWNSSTAASTETTIFVPGSSAARSIPDSRPDSTLRCRPRRMSTGRRASTPATDRNSRAASAIRMVSPTAASSISRLKPARSRDRTRLEVAGSLYTGTPAASSLPGACRCRVSVCLPVECRR